jgi:tetraacyldisaccharide 4'-kinase
VRVVRGVERGPLASVARFGLWFLQWPYRLVVATRNARFDQAPKDSFRAAVPVVSVGNLSVGGTGKTVCVEWIARQLREAGHTVAILSRGYGKGASSQNDEALMLEANLPDVPHLQGADRAALARIAVEELEAEVLVLDDGFQHRQLARDLDIVLLDASQPAVSQWPLPRGTFREPFSSLVRANAVILTRCDQATFEVVDQLESKLRKTYPILPIAKAIHAATKLVGTGDTEKSLDQLHGVKVLTFCGLGNPEAFFATVRSLGASIVDTRVFPDHHSYTKSDVESLRSWATNFPEATLVLTTQKDLVKLRIPDLNSRSLWAVRVEMQFLNGEADLKSLLHALPIQERTEDDE